MDSEQIDRRTNRSIRDAIGARLKRDLSADSSQPSSYLQHLIDELRRIDELRGRDGETAH